KQMIEQEVARVQAETKFLVAGIDQEVKNVGIKVDAELEKMKADYQARIAALDAERTKVLGEADAQAKQMKEIATNNLYQLKLAVFQNDGNAYLRYTLGDKLNPDMILRLFHSGAGTLWTNMNSKGLNFMMPIPSSEPSKSAPESKKKGAPENEDK